MVISEDDITALRAYCKRSGIYVSPSISPKRIPGRGLGIYATRPLKQGQRLASVPTKSIFTTSNIPELFLSKNARKKVAVHAQIAAFFAFADDADLDKYKPWMATWPENEDFVATMPLFWGDTLTEALHDDSARVAANGTAPEEHARKRRRTKSTHTPGPTSQTSLAPKSLSSVYVNNFLPPGLVSSWHPEPTLPPSSPLAQMVAKTASHIESLRPYFPQLNDPASLTALLHTWCLTNTRCFYYHPPNSSSPAPSDPNESMALMPFLDLFNHSDATDTCRVRYTARGFEVTTRRAYAEGEEVEVCYGEHGQDGLWAEYGFMLAGGEVSKGERQDAHVSGTKTANRFDKIALDSIVLEDRRLGQTERELLEEHGYLGDYTMTIADGMCYRTQVAALLITLGRELWLTAVIEGSGHNLHVEHDQAVLAAKDAMRDWCDAALTTSQRRIRELADLGEDETLRVFATASCVHKILHQSRNARLSVATSRKKMCETRWREILGIAEASREALKDM